MIGLLEVGDAGLDFSWVEKLQDVNIITSKNLNDTLIEHLVANKKKIIFHYSVTGFGGSDLEINVPDIKWSRSQYDKLISCGFPANQTVLRIQPIIGVDPYLSKFVEVLDFFSDSAIVRVRFGFLNINSQISYRLERVGVNVVQDNRLWISNILPILNKFNTRYDFESCYFLRDDRVDRFTLSCFSAKDAELLNSEEPRIYGLGGICPKDVVSLLEFKEGFSCSHRCVYCFIG